MSDDYNEGKIIYCYDIFIQCADVQFKEYSRLKTPSLLLLLQHNHSHHKTDKHALYKKINPNSFHFILQEKLTVQL